MNYALLVRIYEVVQSNYFHEPFSVQAAANKGSRQVYSHHSCPFSVPFCGCSNPLHGPYDLRSASSSPVGVLPWREEAFDPLHYASRYYGGEHLPEGYEEDQWPCVDSEAGLSWLIQGGQIPLLQPSDRIVNGELPSAMFSWNVDLPYLGSFSALYFEIVLSTRS